MKTLILTGEVKGVYQDGQGFYCRFKPDDDTEIDLPLNADQFHKLKCGKGKLTLEIE